MRDKLLQTWGVATVGGRWFGGNRSGRFNMSQEGGGGRGDGARRRRNKERRQNAAHKKKKKHSSQQINEDTEQLDIQYTVHLCVCTCE